jgi:tripartite motif-containing protein 71
MTINRFFFIVAPSYNQPKFSSCATWNPDATTFTNSSIVGLNPARIFVSTNSTIYVSTASLNQVVALSEATDTVIQNITFGLNNPYGLFVTNNGDIYVDNGYVNGRVDKWAWNATSSIVVMNVTSRCHSLFIDINDTIYCSQDYENKVVKLSLNSGSNTAIIAAGNGTGGSSSNMLYIPNGIYVDLQFNLYVADYNNDRIQFFKLNQLNATTVAGNGAPGTITLNNPSDVVLDADGYLFIADCNNHRIIGSGPNGFFCVAGCTGISGSAYNQLYHPYSLSFDSDGNLFINDRSNNRIQKFLLATNSCGKFCRRICEVIC